MTLPVKQSAGELLEFGAGDVVPVAIGGTGSTTAPLARVGLNVESLTLVADADYTILATDRVLTGSPAPTATRTWTLPAASSVNAGQSVTIIANPSTFAFGLIISRGGADLINGALTSITLNTARAVVTLYSNGAAGWSTDARGLIDTIAATVSTTDATVTNILLRAIPTGTTMVVQGRVAARRAGGTAGTAEDAGGWEIQAVIKNVAGTATTVGTATVTSLGQDQAGWAVTVSPTGGSLRIRVTGAINNNVNWRLDAMATYVS